MPHHPLTRRHALMSIGALILSPLAPAWAADPLVEVAKDPNCGCCADWAEILTGAGFAVRTTAMTPDALERHKDALGIPAAMRSCHTAQVAGYVLEGHVPVADIRRLLAERPEAIGLAVPGMPYGAPGMGPDTAREAYSVHLIRPGGGTEVFTRYEAA